MLKASVAVAALFVAACGGGDEAGGAVSMAKSLGSVQCAGGGITLPEMQSQLTGAVCRCWRRRAGTTAWDIPPFAAPPTEPSASSTFLHRSRPQPRRWPSCRSSTLPHATRGACR